MENKATPTIGDYVTPDYWPIGECLKASDGWKDASFPGCQFRLPCGTHLGYELAVNIKVTGKPHYILSYGGSRCRSRIKIEFVGDGEPSEYTGGWLYHS